LETNKYLTLKEWPKMLHKQNHDHAHDVVNHQACHAWAAAEAKNGREQVDKRMATQKKAKNDEDG
jgi:hypothetical protein